MYQNIIIPVDHGNRKMKTENFIYAQNYVESEIKPPLGEYLQYNGKYYSLVEKRTPYMRDKTLDERYFILTLFGIAMELERQQQKLSFGGDVIRIDLPVGLPPKHYGGLYEKFERYFGRNEVIEFRFRGKDYRIYLEDVMAFPQDYAAAMTIYKDIKGYGRVTVIDIGGYTMDYLLLRNGKPDMGTCDSLENGVIMLYNEIASRLNSEYDMLVDETDIDNILRGKNNDYPEAVMLTVEQLAQTFVNDLLGSLRERGLDLKNGCVVFVGGGALLLREYLNVSDKIGKHFFVEDLQANAKGYGILYRLQKTAVNAYGKAEKE